MERRNKQYGGDVQYNTIYIDPNNARLLLSELENMKKTKTENKMNDFKKKIKCELKIEDRIVDGTITGIDNGWHVMIKTHDGTYRVHIGENMKICYGLQELAEEKLKEKKNQKGGNELSPRLATSEYLFEESKKQINSGTVSSKLNSSTLNSSTFSNTIDSSEMDSSKMSTSNKSDDYKRVMRGGKKKNRYMKAGSGDKIGIISPEEKIDGYYYSESTSVEEGLCE